jgi:hypothetical protein
VNLPIRDVVIARGGRKDSGTAEIEVPGIRASDGRTQNEESE